MMNAIKLIYAVKISGIIVLLAGMIFVMIVQLIRYKVHNSLNIHVIVIIN